MPLLSLHQGLGVGPYNGQHGISQGAQPNESGDGRRPNAGAGQYRQLGHRKGRLYADHHIQDRCSHVCGGIAFQLVDDVLDYTSCEEVFGKPVGKDLREGKITLPLIYTLCALDRAENERIKSLFQSEKVAEEDLESLISMVREGEAIGRVQAEAREYMRKAAVSLDPFPDSPMKQDLLALNAYLCERRF
ncbi:MAG: polyprenyl synthetase family protein [Deltaproteobacteria bacterium]|nr:polyprenyl synthetase family protein [Deltaproteobacteria bacterium]